MKTVGQLMADAFDRPRTLRSDAYKRGVRAVLEKRLNAAAFSIPYQPGTAEFDAFGAGNDEGNFIWRNISGNENTIRPILT